MRVIVPNTFLRKKRSRGRPKKNGLLVAVKKIKNYLKIKKSRGRPKKLSTRLQSLPFVAALIPKKKRGRPKKLQGYKKVVVFSTKKITHPVVLTAQYAPSQTMAFGIYIMVSLVLLSQLSSVVFADLPTVSELETRRQSVSSKILDRNGTVLYSIYEDENRTIVPLEELPPQIIYATIAIEDQNFFGHHGFSPKGIMRAAISNIKGEQIQGGSTLTQQLVKTRLLSTEKTYTRKLRELILALLVELKYSKQEILQMYLNEISYGGSTYGIEEATQRYFGKHASELDLAEASILAGLPAAPSIYTPFGATPELAKARQAEVLRRMKEDGYISEEQQQQALNEELAFRTDTVDIKAPHFVMYIRDLLLEMYGEEMLAHEGLIVTTTLDLPTQDAAQEIVSNEIAGLQGLRVSNGASLITNPQTGEIISMVGSTDYFDFEHDGQVNIPLRERQPGSSIKPLTYAMALERGKTPLSVITDSPVTYTAAGSLPYAPQNYDGKFHGNVTLKEALASSYNIPAVKLLNEIGVGSYIDKAEQMGISTWDDRSRFGLSLTLGGGEVTMLEMTQLYGAFANGGYSIEANPLLEVKNYKGEVLYRNECVLDGAHCTKTRVLDEGVAYLITSMLADNTARTPAFGPLSTLYIPGQEVAVKTGTTNNLRDNWTFGYTGERLVATWVGNNDNTPMSYVASGVTGASSMWNDIMRTQLSDLMPYSFPVPDTIARVAICPGSTNPCATCGSPKTEYFLKTNTPATCTAAGQTNQPIARRVQRAQSRTY
ncbi:PBP1A family penicillin-binding protein [Candidatus Woesebacteria bacterium]|nr:PBP1A family penicillin-binding protein [Candidatus Woesebacteria bacterium]